MEGVSCGLSTGSKLAISATVLWFVCNNMIPVAVVPEPLWEGPPQPTPGVPPAAAGGDAAGEAATGDAGDDKQESA